MVSALPFALAFHVIGLPPVGSDRTRVECRGQVGAMIRASRPPSEATMSTPAKARALRKLASAKRANTERLAKGQDPKIGGKTVSKATYAKKTGVSTSKAAAKARLRKR